MMFSLFAGLAFLVAAVGMFSVVAYLVEQRWHEIGVRVALGARAVDVVGLVLKQGLTLAAIGVAIGLAASFALTRLMKGLLFGVGAADPLTFVVISSLLIGVALTAAAGEVQPSGVAAAWARRQAAVAAAVAGAARVWAAQRKTPNRLA